MKFLKALNLGFMILNALEAVVTGQPAVLFFDYDKKRFQLSLTQTSVEKP